MREILFNIAATSCQQEPDVFIATNENDVFHGKSSVAIPINNIM